MFIKKFAVAILFAFLSISASAQMMYGNDFPFWTVDGALTVKAGGSESFLNLTASKIVATDANSALTTISDTGTGNIVRSASPTFTGTISGANETLSGTLGVTGVATLTAQPILSSLTASQAVFSDSSKGLVSNAITGTGNVVMSASPTLTGTIIAAGITASAIVNAATAIISTSASPAAADACTAGRIVWDASYIYVCTATGVWKRAGITGGY